MTKIALIIERLNLSLGGAERSTYEIACELEKQGYDTTILAATAAQQTEKAIALCSNDPKARISFKIYETALKQHLKTHKYDLIHSTLPLDAADIYHPMGGSYTETYLRNATSYPGWVTPWWKRLTHFINSRRSQFLKAEQKLCQHPRIAIAAQSNYVIRQFKEHYGLDDDRLFLVPNGVDVETHFTELQADRIRNVIDTKLVIEDRKNTTVLVFAANNFRLKGLRDLLIAMSLCQRTAPNRRIVIVVAGSANDRRYQALARRLKIENNVYFHGYTDNIQSFLAVCDAAVLPSYYDPCSRYILEALAMNIPVLTTRFNGASEYYTHHRHGVILERPDDVLAFAHGLAFLSSPENRQAAAQAIKEDRLIEKLSIEHHCRKIAKMYNVLLKRKDNAQ